MNSEEKILEVLKNSSALKSAQIAEQSGLETKEVSKILKKLKAEGSIIVPKACYYEYKK